jgi:hypothetical protein
MDMRSRFLSAVALTTLLAATRAEAQFRVGPETVPAEDFHVELSLMFWQPDPELTLTTGDVSVGAVDFVETFGIESERFREFRVTLKPGRKHKIRFARVPIKYDQDAVLERTISFQNRLFPATFDGNANISWDVYKVGYEWDFLALPRGFVGVVGQVNYNKVNAEVGATGSAFGQPLTVSASLEQNAPVPTLGAVARGYLGDYVSLTGDFTFFKYDNDRDFRGKFYDFDIYGAAHFGKYLGAQVGYRQLDVDFLVDGDAGTMKMKGPYFGGFLRF